MARVSRNSISIEVRNLKGLLRQLKELPKSVQEELEWEMAATAEEMANGAIQDAPRDQARLINTISSARVGRLSFKVVCSADYAAFVEFGTRRRVQIPPELAEVAAKFRGLKIGGGDAKEMIFAWCKRVGIPQERWYPTFLSIMVNGRKAHPFFFKQMTEGRAAFNKRIEAIFERAIKKND